MNEYTRREEVRWTLVTAVLLVVCIAVAIVLLTTAQGALVPDPIARQAADASASRVDAFKHCKSAAEKLAEELAVLKKLAKTTNIEEEEEEPKPPPFGQPRPKKDESKSASVAWKVAEPAHKYAKSLGECRATTDEMTGNKARAGWDAVAYTARVQPPKDDVDEAAQMRSAKEVQVLLADAPIDEVVAAVTEADQALARASEQSQTAASNAFIREPLPPGLLGRKVAIATGLGLALAALLVSFFSVRAASIKRAAELIPLRPAAKTTHRGHQAASILRLAAQHNGGEPGLVVGAAAGGALAAALSRTDADWFVAGVMGGLLLGLVGQLIARAVGGLSHWRERAKELAEVEKPTLPIVLVLSGVNEGQEEQFVDFISGLPPQEAAVAVEQLANQAEERILMAAEAGALRSQNPPAVAP